MPNKENKCSIVIVSECVPIREQAKCKYYLDKGGDSKGYCAYSWGVDTMYCNNLEAQRDAIRNLLSGNTEWAVNVVCTLIGLMEE